MKLNLLFGMLLLTQTLLAQTFTEVASVPGFDGVAFGCSVTFADVDGDNDQDVLITGENSSSQPTAKLYINDGTGHFTEMTDTPFDGVKFSFAAFTDVDGDNDQDVLITGTNSSAQPTAKLYTNDGVGNFTQTMGTPFDGVGFAFLAFTDVDGDDDQDVLITGTNSSSVRIAKLYTNDGAGNFTETMGTPFDGVSAGTVAFADVDGDNDQDVLITGNNSSIPTAKLYTNDGAGNYTEMMGTPFDGVELTSAAFTDVDGDGDQDVLITGASTVARIAKLYTNDGTGNFTEMTDTPFGGVVTGFIAFADVDNDNDQDVLITGISGSSIATAKLYTNDGMGNFTRITDTPFEGVASGSCVAFADVDGDNDQDVLIAGRNNSPQPTAKLYTRDGMVSSTDEIFLKLNLDFTLYPNPLKSNTLNISFDSDENGFASLKVYDLMGKCLRQQEKSVGIGLQTTSIDITHLVSGSYFLHIDLGRKKGKAKFLVTAK